MPGLAFKFRLVVHINILPQQKNNYPIGSSTEGGWEMCPMNSTP
jgi:hypothetical protein